MNLQCIHHVQLAMPAGQEDRARFFYADILGLTEVPKPGTLAGRGGVWFELVDLRVHLGVEADFRPAEKAHPAFQTDDLEVLTNHLERQGIAVIRDADLPGYKRAYVADPFGNRIELLQPDD